MGSFLVILSALGFSTLGIFGKFAMSLGFTRNQTLFYRFGLSLPILSVILAVTKAYPTSKKGFQVLGKAILLGAVGIGIEATLYFVSLEHLGAAITGIFLYLFPMFVALISHFFLKEHLNERKWVSVVLAFLGSILTVGVIGGSSVGMVSPLKDIEGLIFGILTGAWYAVYLLVANRMTKGENPLLVSSGVVTGSFLAFFFLTLVEVGGGAKLMTLSDARSLEVMLALAIVASVLPFTTLYAGMKRVGAVRASLISTSELVFTIVLAYFFLDEKLTIIQLSGAFLILVSVLLAA